MSKLLNTCEMSPNRRIFLNIVATYGRSLFALVCGCSRRDGCWRPSDRRTSASTAWLAGLSPLSASSIRFWVAPSGVSTR